MNVLKIVLLLQIILLIIIRGFAYLIVLLVFLLIQVQEHVYKVVLPN